MATATAAPPRSRRQAPELERAVFPEQHSLARSVVLHLLPGAALFGFVVAAASVGIEPVVALIFGIALVIVPIELGYLLVQARRRNGSWSLAGVVGYRERLSARETARLAIPLVLWWMVVLAVSTAVLDKWFADALFAWYPESVREFASFEGGNDSAAPGLLIVLLLAALAINGVIGPVVEELYFRGHLLPRIDRFGRKAPVLNAVLFSLYHLWTPWQNPGRIVAMVPVVFTVWKKRSIRLSIVVHISVNTLFLLLIVPAFL
jgi:uncharacterized protein